MHGGSGFLHAPTSVVWVDFGGIDVGARRISPLWPEQEYCSDYVFGIWVVWLAWEEPRAQLAQRDMGTVDIWLNGEPLPVSYGAWKRIPDPEGLHFGGEPFWTRSEGVPFYGTLDVGTYHLHWERHIGGEVRTLDSDVTIVDCSD